MDRLRRLSDSEANSIRNKKEKKLCFLYSAEPQAVAPSERRAISTGNTGLEKKTARNSIQKHQKGH